MHHLENVTVFEVRANGGWIHNSTSCTLIIRKLLAVNHPAETSTVFWLGIKHISVCSQERLTTLCLLLVCAIHSVLSFFFTLLPFLTISFRLLWHPVSRGRFASNLYTSLVSQANVSSALSVPSVHLCHIHDCMVEAKCTSNNRPLTKT